MPGNPPRRRPISTVSTIFALALLLTLWQTLPPRPSVGIENDSKPGKGVESGVVRSVAVKSKAIALTFDDGPDPVYTPPVLDILRRHHVRCTFFLLGYEVLKYPQVARQIAADGHEIGCHGYTHKWLKNLPEATVEAELDKCERVFRDVLNVRPSLFRFPGLYSDAVSLKAVQSRGYTVIHISLDSNDWKSRDPKLVAKRVISLVKPGDIILMHEWTGKRLKKPEVALEEILETLSEQGYEFLTVSELIRRGAREGATQGGGD